MLPGASRRGGISLRGPSMDMTVGQFNASISPLEVTYGYCNGNRIGSNYGSRSCGSLSTDVIDGTCTVVGLFEVLQDADAQRWIAIKGPNFAAIDSTMSRIRRMRLPSGAIITSPHLLAVSVAQYESVGNYFKGWALASGVSPEYDPRLQPGIYQLLG